MFSCISIGGWSLGISQSSLCLSGRIYQRYECVDSDGCSWPRQCLWCDQVPVTVRRYLL